MPVVVDLNADNTEYYEVLEYAQRKSEYPFVSFLVDEMKRTFRIIKKYSIIWQLTQVRQAEVVTLIITDDYGFHPLIFGTTSLSFNR